MKNILFSIFALLLLSTHGYTKAFDLVITPSHDEEPTEKEQPKKQDFNGKKLFIMINSSDLQKAGMGLSLALDAAQKGTQTTILLGAKALLFAQAKGKQNKFIALDMTPREMLEKALKSSASLQIYALCASTQGVTKSDFIKGANLIKSEEVLEKIYKKDTKLLSF